MIDPERQEADAIIAELAANLQAAHQEIERWKNHGAVDRPASATSNNDLCVGCYGWRIVLCMILGACCGLGAWVAVENNRQFVEAILGDADAVALSLTVAASLPPLALVVLDWKIRLYKAGYPGLIRATANMLAEFKRGLRA